MGNDWAIMGYKEFLVCGELVKIDDVDMHLFSGKTWRVYKYGTKKYLKWVGSKNSVQFIVSIHRVILGAGDGEIVDHINGNSLDNRRCNLRVVSAEKNQRNRFVNSTGKTKSIFKGVSKYRNKWTARIKVGGVSIYIGSYGSEFEAAYSYDIASLALHKEYGRTNFLPLALF